MLFNDLLRVSVLLVAGVATALGGGRASSSPTAMSTRSRSRSPAPGGCSAAAAGTWLGRPAQTAGAMSRVLAGARTATSLPSESPGRIAFMRLWPIGAFALAVGVAGLVLAAGRGDRRRLRDR